MDGARRPVEQEPLLEIVERPLGRRRQVVLVVRNVAEQDEHPLARVAVVVAFLLRNSEARRQVRLPQVRAGGGVEMQLLRLGAGKLWMPVAPRQRAGIDHAYGFGHGVLLREG